MNAADRVRWILAPGKRICAYRLLEYFSMSMFNWIISIVHLITLTCEE